MNRKRIYLSVLTFFLIAVISCTGYRTTKFKYGTIETGTDKEKIIQKYGTPFKADLQQEEGNLKEMLRYKEAVDVGSYTYILTTDLHFVNSKLIKMEQKESVPPNSSKGLIK